MGDAPKFESDPTNVHQQAEYETQAAGIQQKLADYYALSVNDRMTQYKEMMDWIEANVTRHSLDAVWLNIDADDMTRFGIAVQRARFATIGIEDHPVPIFDTSQPYAVIAIDSGGKIRCLSRRYVQDGYEDAYARAILQKAVTEGLMNAQADEVDAREGRPVKDPLIFPDRGPLQQDPEAPFERGGFLSWHNVQKARRLGYPKHEGAATVYFDNGSWMTIGASGRSGGPEFMRLVYGSDLETNEWQDAGAVDGLLARATALAIRGLEPMPPQALQVPVPNGTPEQVIDFNQ